MCADRINIISPHRDDAAFSVGLSALSCTDLRISVRLITCFTLSAYAPYRKPGSTTDVTELRAAEDRAFTSAAGISEASVDLGYAEAALRLPKRRICGSDRLYPSDTADVDRLAEDLAAACLTGPVFLPLAVGHHIDHLVTLHAGIRATTRAFLGFYEDLPYACWGGSVDIARQVHAVEELLQAKLVSMLVKRPAGETEKRRLVECYPSQIPEVQALQIIRYALQFGPGERLWVTASMREWLIRRQLAVEPEKTQRRLPKRLLSLRSATNHSLNAVRYKAGVARRKLFS